MTGKLGFAVVGCGKFGIRRVRAIAMNPGAKLVGVVDSNKEVARQTGEEFKCEHFTDFHKVLEREDVDCVLVATPNKFHAPIAIEAMKMGKHVFCEKPLAKTPLEAKEMVKTADENGVFLKTGSNLRYFSNIQKARELLDQGAIGKPLFMRGWVGHDGKKVVGSWNVDPELAGGGTLIDNGPHILDLFRWFMGDFAECTGYVGTIRLPVKVEDNGVGLFRTSDGRSAFVQSSWNEWCGYMYLEVYGEKGYIHADNRGKTSKVILGGVDGGSQVFDFSGEPPRSYELEIQDYMDAIKAGRQPTASGVDGMRVLEMIYGIYESSKTGRTVKLP